jgi:hypothetical protein
MQNIADEDTWFIAPFHLVSVRLEQEQPMRIVTGRVWITIEADATDYWLAAGETIVLPPDRHIVIEAGTEHSCVDVISQSVNPVLLAPHIRGGAKLIHII